MKTIYLTTMITLFLLFGLNALQAQTTQTPAPAVGWRVDGVVRRVDRRHQPAFPGPIAEAFSASSPARAGWLAITGKARRGNCGGDPQAEALAQPGRILGHQQHAATAVEMADEGGGIGVALGKGVAADNHQIFSWLAVPLRWVMPSVRSSAVVSPTGSKQGDSGRCGFRPWRETR